MHPTIRTTTAAKQVIRTREELAALLKVDAEFVARVVADPSRFYSSFQVPKANGEFRTIQPPCPSLRELQRSLLKVIYARIRVPRWMHGGVRQRSIVTHAHGHVGRLMVATLDIRKFFPSTTPAFLGPVFAELGFADTASEDLENLVFFDGGLPQGAPTSSILANLAFIPGDNRFLRICRSRHLAYSRYVDDIAVSGDQPFNDLRGPFIAAIESIGYAIAPDKVHFISDFRRQVVTGLVVNDRLRPTGEFLAELKHEIRLCLDHGATFIANLHGTPIGSLKSRLTGRVGHVLHVDPKRGKKLRGMLCGVNWKSSRPYSSKLAEGVP